MIKVQLMKYLGRWMSRALLGPVHVHGGALDNPENAPDIILVPHAMSAADCWLFWSRLKRPPVFYDAGLFSDCWGYRWLCERTGTYEASEASILNRMYDCLTSGRTLVISTEARSPSALKRLETQLQSLHARHGGLKLQMLTFNYDFRHTLGSPVHWIWRPEALSLSTEQLDLQRELQALQKLAWTVNGYQTLPNFPLVNRAGRVPSSLLLSWHEVRARRRWRMPGPVSWLWVPLAMASALLNLAPWVAAFALSHFRGAWRIEQQAAWLVPLYLLNHLAIGGTILAMLGFGALMLYLPWIAVGVHPLGILTARLMDQEDTPDVRTVRERILNYFD